MSAKMIPTSHLNGTGVQTLRKEYHAAYRAVREAIDALSAVTVHGRDYYPQGDHAFAEARAEHVERLGKLQSVQQDLEELYNALD